MFLIWTNFGILVLQSENKELCLQAHGHMWKKNPHKENLGVLMTLSPRSLGVNPYISEVQE